MPLEDHESVRRLFERFESRCENDPEKYAILSKVYNHEDTKEVGAVAAALFSELCDFCLELLESRLLLKMDVGTTMKSMGLTRDEYNRGMERCKERLQRIAGHFPAYGRMVADRI